jgi:hypothetical protein
VAAWVIGLCLAILADSLSSWKFPNLLLGATVGLLGGAVLFRQISRAGREPAPFERGLAQVMGAPLTHTALLAVAWGINWLSGDFFASHLSTLWSDVPELLAFVLRILVIAVLNGLALATVTGMLRQPLGVSGLLSLTVIGAITGIVNVAVIFLLGLFEVDGELPGSLLGGLLGGAATAWYLARRFGQPASLGLLAASAGAWMAAFAVSGQIFDAWYHWTNHFLVGVVAALGSLPLFYSLRSTNARINSASASGSSSKGN